MWKNWITCTLMVGMYMVQLLWETVWQFLKMLNKIAIKTSNSILRYTQKNWNTQIARTVKTDSGVPHERIRDDGRKVQKRANFPGDRKYTRTPVLGDTLCRGQRETVWWHRVLLRMWGKGYLHMLTTASRSPDREATWPHIPYGWTNFASLGTQQIETGEGYAPTIVCNVPTAACFPDLLWMGP